MQTEHFDLTVPLFLPVTEETCAAVLAGDKHSLDALSEPELAALLVIQNLAQVAEEALSPAAAERILSRLLGWSVDTRHTSPQGLLSEAKRLHDPNKLYFGIEAIKKSRLCLLLADEVSAQDYLLPDGKWDADFKFRHARHHNPFRSPLITSADDERWLSAAQDHLVRTFKANLDEHLHLQGYAGIGKSYLIGALVDCLRPEQTLVLARTADKLAVLRKRIRNSTDLKCMTFLDFAHVLLRSFRRPAGASGKGPGKEAMAQELNIVGVGQRSASATLDICLSVLASYCRSRDFTLSRHHLPRLQQSLSAVDAAAVLEYSSRLWVQLEAKPAWWRHTGFETLLMIKRANLAGCVVSPRYAHVLIDESQDVPSSLLQIIERSRQVLVTLGDEYQQGSRDVLRRKSDVRQASIGYSVRSGRSIERLLNPLIARHSNKTKVPFEGARNAEVGVEEYPEAFVPPEDCVVLTASVWDTMKWAIQLGELNCAFSFPTRPQQGAFLRFMNTAIAMFNPRFYEQGKEGAHPYFNEWTQWSQVREANQFDESFLWVESELGKGFKVADLTSLNSMIGTPGTGCVLMPADEAGGMEFNHVLLTPGLLTTQKFKDVYAFDERICAVYIAISRAKRRLYVPYDVLDWVEHHERQKFRELS